MRRETTTDISILPEDVQRRRADLLNKGYIVCTHKYFPNHEGTKCITIMHTYRTVGFV